MCLMGLCVGCASVREPFTVDLSFVHPVQKPSDEIALAAVHAVPQEVKDRTHLFFINGLDPYYLANFGGQCQYMKSLGYYNSHFGQWNEVEPLRRKIVEIYQHNPDIRIVLVGYSVGANSAQTLARQLRIDGVPVELLVYVAGDFITDTRQPLNVKRILSVSGHTSIVVGYDLFLRAPEIEGASNYRFDVRHFQVPTRTEMMDLLIQHVMEIEPSRRAVNQVTSSFPNPRPSR